MNFMFVSEGYLFISQFPARERMPIQFMIKRDLRLFFIFCTKLTIKSSKYLI